MKSSRWVDLVVIVLVVALGARLLGPRQRHPLCVDRDPSPLPLVASAPDKWLTGRYSCHGVAPGMTQEDTVRVIGKPTCSGKLNVAGGTGSYAEYGNARLTWEGHPTISFTSDGVVLAVMGDRAYGPRGKVVQLNDSTDQVRAALGEPQHREAYQQDPNSETWTYDDSKARTNLTLRGGRLTRILISSVR